VKESPEWLKNKLNIIGLRPINNIVDITNYIMMAYGQPMHCFDADMVKGNKIVVKDQNAGKKFITLDGEERTGFISDDAIILGNQDAGEKVLRFSRVAPLGVYFVPVAAEDATISDYIGEWSCQYAHLGTKLVSLAALDGAAELTVTPLMANMYIRDTSDSETATNHAISLSDGALLLGSAAAPDYTLQLLTDGTVMCRLESGVTYYFQKTAN
jgi:hypothetical protein